MNTLLTFLCLGLLSAPTASPFLSPPAGIDLRVEHGTFADPPPVGYYSYYVHNDSDDTAPNVTLSCDIPTGALFGSVRVNDMRARADGPTSGNRGHVEVRIPDLPAHSFVSVDFYLEYDGELGAPAFMRLEAASDAVDPNPDNNSYDHENYVSVVPGPAVLTGVTSVNDSTAGFVIVITGRDFSGYSNDVGIGCGCEPWYHVVNRSPTEIWLVGGKELRKKFPKGTPVEICVTVPGTSTAYISYTRH